MNNKDYYKVLGVDRGASDAQIKKAYKKLALQYHPDRNVGDQQAEKVFKEISEAYSIVGDPQKRQEYDNGPQTYVGGHGFSGFTTGFTVNMNSGFDSIFSHFDEIFGGAFGGNANRQTRRSVNPDIDVELNLTFEEAALGCTKASMLQRHIACETCKGSGTRGGATSNCANCGGTGMYVQQQGYLRIKSVCSTCEGSGKIIVDACLNCSGDGIKVETQTVDIKVPAGINHGDCLRVANKGEHVYSDAPAGHLNIHLRVGHSSIFKRKENDIYSTEYVDIATLMLGGELKAQTIHGIKNFKIKPGFQPNSEFRVAEEGIHNADGTKGNHYIVLKLQVPVDLNAEQEEAFKKFADLLKS